MKALRKFAAGLVVALMIGGGSSNAAAFDPKQVPVAACENVADYARTVRALAAEGVPRSQGEKVLAQIYTFKMPDLTTLVNDAAYRETIRNADQFYEALAESCEQNEGDLTKFLGEGV